MGDYTLIDKELFMLRTFIEALGYEKQDSGIWRINISYLMPEKTYEDFAIIDEENLKSMTLNDAMLCVIDTKRAKEAELEFKIKFDIEMPEMETQIIDDSVQSFVKFHKSADCPNCL